MKVIVATIEWQYEGSVARGVYTTQELAEKATSKYLEQSNLIGDNNYYSTYQEIVIDDHMLTDLYS